MSESVFFRVLEPEPSQKWTRLARQVADYRDGRGDDSAEVFLVDTEEFSAVPETPFAYWVGHSVRRIFRDLPPLDGNVGTVRQGLATAYDFRFLRAWWEVDSRRIGFTRSHTHDGRGWVHFAKGGTYSPYHSDIHLVVNWIEEGQEIKNRISSKTGRPRSNVWMLGQTEKDFFFRPGLTWPLRTHSFCPQPLPAGSIFSVRGYGLFAESALLPALLAFLSSTVFDYLFKLCLGRFGHPEFIVGILKRLPVPAAAIQSNCHTLSEYGLNAATKAQASASTNEISKSFILPQYCRQDYVKEQVGPEETLLNIQSEIDELTFDAYSLPYKQRDYIYSDDFGTDKVTQLREDLDCHLETESGSVHKLSEPSRVLAELFMWCVGVAFGRWDARMAKDRSLIPDLQGPFERLPRVTPGGLVGSDGLPATEDRIASEGWLRARPDVITLPNPREIEGEASITADEYPVDVGWDGVLVDDPGHPRDIVGKVREDLRYLYGGGRAEAIEEEALEILRADGRTPGSLRDWFRNRTATELGRNFFDFHARRYSKSRRKAPIYWRLCSNPGRGQSEYGVWLYYHRLTDDTLWTLLNSYVGPKLERVQQRTEKLRLEIEKTEGSESRRFEKEREEALELLEELRWFEGELRKVAESGWKPERDDGVVINLAPFHKVMRWNEPEKHWKRLQQGEYDWSLTAMRYWPDRVREKCRTDRSLAIAHGLEELYEGE